MNEWALLLLWPLLGWICGSFTWTDTFVTSDLPGMLLFYGLSGPMVLFIRPLCRLVDRFLMKRKLNLPLDLKSRFTRQRMR